jgi:hypothetical protein
MRRVSLLAPSQAITQSASARKMPSGVSMLSTAWSGCCCSDSSRCFQASVISGCCAIFAISISSRWYCCRLIMAGIWCAASGSRSNW